MSSHTNTKAAVRIVEVGPRDGLQNIKQRIPTELKLELIQRLHDSGLSTVEITSIVSARAIPQLADCEAVLANDYVQSVLLGSPATVRAPVLVPHVKALDIALKHNVKEVAVFVSASEGFSQKNIRCSVQEALDRSRKVAAKARAHGLNVRGYVSCVFACPFDGPTPAAAVQDCVKQLLDMGCYEISLGDTVGVGVPTDVERLLSHLVSAGIPVAKLAGHFHDTYGQALANLWAAYRCGVRVFDSSISGLGGCPYAPGAKGNVSTEDVVYSLHQAGIPTGVDLAKLVDTGAWVSEVLGLQTSSRAGSAILSKVPEPSLPPTSKIAPLHWVPESSKDGLELFRQGTNLKIVLNRPRNGNAMTTEMIENLTQLFKNAATDSSISRIAITARGKYFCTGMDLGKGRSPVAKGGSVADAQYSRLFQLFEAIDNAPQVTVAVVQGPAFGGGVGLLLSCDIRIMSDSATIQLSEVRLGLAPATISKYVVRELGVAFAREVMLSSRVVTASELLRLGKIASVLAIGVDPSVALDEYLLSMRQCAPHASTMCKQLVRLNSVDGGESKDRQDSVRAVFASMMSPESESSYGLKQFQAGNKKLDWDDWLLAKKSVHSKL